MYCSFLQEFPNVDHMISHASGDFVVFEDAQSL